MKRTRITARFTLRENRLVERGLEFERQKSLPIVYRGTTIDCGYRVDFLVEGQIIVELKAIQRFEPVHVAQVIS